MKRLTYIDLFAGCGGLTDGFEQSGMYDAVAHVEIDKIAAATLAHRIRTGYARMREDEVLVYDIQRTRALIDGWSNDPVFGSNGGLKRRLGLRKKLDVLIGGPPCQAYSLAGRIRDADGMQNDYRNYLFESYIDVLKWAEPKVFVFENVPGILSAAPGGKSIVSRISSSFSKAGYTVLPDFRHALFDMSEFGVPQKRTRVILIGLSNARYGRQALHKLVDFYSDFIASNAVSTPVTASAAIGDLPKFFPVPRGTSTDRTSHEGATKAVVCNHTPRFHNSRDIEIFRMLAEDLQTGRMRYQSADALKALYTEKTGRTSAVHKYHVLRPDKPSNTIPAHLYKDGLRHIHWDPDQARSITVREAARLQGFDDSFEFLGAVGDQYRMIGNAVPPSFGRKLAVAIGSTLI